MRRRNAPGERADACVASASAISSSVSSVASSNWQAGASETHILQHGAEGGAQRLHAAVQRAAVHRQHLGHDVARRHAVQQQHPQRAPQRGAPTRSAGTRALARFQLAQQARVGLAPGWASHWLEEAQRVPSALKYTGQRNSCR